MPKRVLLGVVVSDKTDKTVVVKVERRFTHPLFKKTVRRTKNYHAHDDKNEFKVGEKVWIEECAPISKLKKWVVLSREQAAVRITSWVSESFVIGQSPLLRRSQVDPGPYCPKPRSRCRGRAVRFREPGAAAATRSACRMPVTNTAGSSKRGACCDGV